MKKVLFLIFTVILSTGTGSAQKLVIGGKSPGVKVGEWLSPEPDAGKAVLLEFFHTSNKQCEERLSQLEDLAKKYSAELNVIVISKEPKDKVQPIIWSRTRSYYAAMDDSGRTFEDFGIQFVPFGVLIDKKGRIAWFGNQASFDEQTFIDNL